MLKDLNRRSFLLRASLVMGGIYLNGCIGKINGRAKEYVHIKGKLLGPNEKAGHLLRGSTADLPASAYSRNVKTLIIGGGVSGLSTGRWLRKQNYEDFEILELEGHVGGNAHHKSNLTSAYPLGAHYITIANNDDELLLRFLEEQGVITHYENGLPFYNEYYLCFDPEERLLINGQWQEGLIPQFGVPEGDKAEINRFLKFCQELKQQKGNDGKYFFNIPIDHSSSDSKYRLLDQQSFKDYLLENGFTSSYLRWYLNYCCKDDYGQEIDHISAWAGLNYFAGHKGRAANAEEGAVLTWPEGNGWLIERLRVELKSHITTSAMAFSVKRAKNGKIEIGVFDVVKKSTYTVIAENLIMASPQFVNKKLLAGNGMVLSNAEYSPWVVANITLKDIPSDGIGLCWDNVPYDRPSVGYVYAGQQQVGRDQLFKNITLYLPLCDSEPRISRLAAYARNYDQWLAILVPELEFMHPGITALIEEMEIWVWGHGMVSPKINYIWGKERAEAGKNIDNAIFFAHTDLSGISLFEEGFHQGIKAAKELLKKDDASR